jgi:hypothetical protein
MVFLDGSLTNLGGADVNWPEGRNVRQWQIVDDFTITFGRHTFKAGINWRKNDVQDFDYGSYTSGLELEGSLNNFFYGGVAPGGFDYLQQKFLTAPSEPIFLWNMGIYGQDEFRVGRNLKITAALRIDHNANPQCNTNCFSQFAVPFTELDHDPTIPYNQAIQTNLHTAYYSTDKVVWQPRVGFAWSPNEKTVVRGGAGIFSDGFPALIVDNFSSNPPNVNAFIVTGAPLSPAQSGNLFSLASGSNASFASAFNSGGTLASIEASNPYFSPPSFSSEDPRIRQPHYYEWNLEVQREVGWHTILDLNYVGNHGAYEPLSNTGLNAYDPSGFAGLPLAPPDPRFGTVTEYGSSNYSNYDGLVVRVNHSFSHGLLFQLNYSWSHALDVCSNGCLEQFNLDTAASILNPQNPFDARANYGNADYDVRHYFSANYVWDDVIRRFSHWGPNAVLGGWTVSGTWFVRSGFPFTVVDTAASGTLSGFNDGGPYFGNVIGTGSSSCGEAAAGPNATPCVNASEFSPSTSNPAAFGNQGRNTFRGPGYFNTDLAISKSFRFPRWESGKLTIGAQAFNLLNHPNFDLPVNDISNTNPTTGFGDITRTVNPPTSILGSFLGGDASTRMIQIKAQFQF